MTTNANPSRNIANDNELSGLFIEVLGKFLSGVDDMLPAIIKQYDAASNRATVRPVVQVLSTDGGLTNRAPVVSIPVFQLGGGGYMLRLNPRPGDLGWIKANDRDISLFLQSYTDSRPNTYRKHAFEDAVFFPDVMRGYTVTDGEDCSLQSVDGSVRISLMTNAVKVTAANMEITGNLRVGGDIEASNVEASGEITAGTIALTTHTHTGSPTAAPGPVSPTGAPVT